MSQSVVFIGLGSMGTPMARNLLKGGLHLFVYNRTKDKSQSLLNEGAQAIDNPKDAFIKATIVVSMLANDRALEEVVFGPTGLLQSARKGTLHISMSTVSPETTRKLEKAHQEKGVLFLAAPVFGRPDAAGAGKLVICQAGSAEAKKIAEPILKLLGQKIEDFGDASENANVVKLIGNFMILSAVETMGEGFHLGEKNGLQPQQLQTFFSETIFACPVYQNYGKVIAEQKFEPAGFKLSLGLKDFTLVKQTADRSHVAMPIAGLIYELLQEGVTKGRSNMDWSAVTLSSKK